MRRSGQGMSRQISLHRNNYFESFENAKWKLKNTEEAASNALKLLNKFREKNMKIIHVRHEFNMENPPFFAPNSQGAKIHDSLTPKENETQVLKHDVNSFKNTNLKEILDDLSILGFNVKNVEIFN